MTCNVAFIGLGVMGYPMAGYISKAGHNVSVFNRTTAKAEKWISEYKGKMASSPKDAAEGGILTVMVGGDEESFKKAEPVIDCYSKKVKLIGQSGSGQLTKMMNQMCIAGVVQGLSEAINFGINAGLDIDKVMETISKGAAQSWQMENRYKTMVKDKFDYGFAVDWMRKDLKIVIEEAKRNGSPVPITEIVDEYYADVQKMGGNRWDSSSLIARLKKKK